MVISTKVINYNKNIDNFNQIKITHVGVLKEDNCNETEMTGK
jgi:hypothetical protein